MVVVVAVVDSTTSTSSSRYKYCEAPLSSLTQGLLPAAAYGRSELRGPTRAQRRELRLNYNRGLLKFGGSPFSVSAALFFFGFRQVCGGLFRDPLVGPLM